MRDSSPADEGDTARVLGFQAIELMEGRNLGNLEEQRVGTIIRSFKNINQIFGGSNWQS